MDCRGRAGLQPILLPLESTGMLAGGSLNALYGTANGRTLRAVRKFLHWVENRKVVKDWARGVVQNHGFHRRKVGGELGFHRRKVGGELSVR